MEAVILGLTGRMGAGKDTVFQRLDALYPRVVQISYARKLKESVAALFGITLEDIERWKNDPKIGVVVRGADGYSYSSQTFREMLQKFGTEAHRDVFGQDFWLDAALPIDGAFARDTIYVVTDVRFENEVQRVHDVGGKIVKVVGTLTDDPSAHASEKVPRECDFIIDNVIRNDEFEALDYQLRSLIEHLDPSQKGAA